VADDATDGCATNGAKRTAAGQHGTSDGTDAGADGGILVLVGHPGTPAETEQHR